MHVGIKVPNWGALAGPDALERAAMAAEERGFGSVWVSDHLAMPASSFEGSPDGSPPPFDANTPFIEALLALTYLAAVTRRVQLCTGVLVLPLRHPLAVAKQAASLDALSHGRLVLGVGAGWLAEEFALFGQGFADRGERMDSAIGFLRACWAGEELPLLDARRLGRVAINPLPTQGARVPVIVGGHSPPALRRAARLGDGWYASNVTAAQFGVLVSRLRAQLDPSRGRIAAGVRPAPIEATEAAATVAAFQEAGASFVVLDAPYTSMSLEQAGSWVHRVADNLDLSHAAEPIRSVVETQQATGR